MKMGYEPGKGLGATGEGVFKPLEADKVREKKSGLDASKHDDTIKEEAEETPSKPKKASKETTIDLSTSKRR